MIKKLFTILILLLIFNIYLSAQWQKIDTDFNGISSHFGLNTKIAFNDSKVFYYETKVHRYDENGDNPEEITSEVPEFVYFLYRFDGVLYANNWQGLHTSEDNGSTWTLLSAPSVSDGGSLVRIVNDGEIFYGITNRKSILRSTDRGATWEEILIDIDYVSLNDLAVKGDTFFGTIPSGMWISKDAGQTWTLSNPSESHPMWGAYNYKGKIIGMNTNNGMYVYDFNTDSWLPSSKGIVSDGSSFWARSITSYGNTLFLKGVSRSENKTYIYTSTDEGNTWNPMSMANLPDVLNQASAWNLLVAGDNYLYYHIYTGPGNQDNGLYAMAHSAVTSIDRNENLPQGFELSQNYPNPFNPTTSIQYTIPVGTLSEVEVQNVSLKVYDVLGNEVATLVNGYQSPGIYNVNFDASSLSSGLYFYKLAAGNFSQTNKMILLK
jgi:hypothetical protein